MPFCYLNIFYLSIPSEILVRSITAWELSRYWSLPAQGGGGGGRATGQSQQVRLCCVAQRTILDKTNPEHFSKIPDFILFQTSEVDVEMRVEIW